MPEERTIANQRAAAMVAETVPLSATEGVHYLDSDRHFLPDHTIHARATVNLRSALTQHFRNVKNVVLEGNMFV